MKVAEKLQKNQLEKLEAAKAALDNDDNAFSAALSSRHYFHMLSVHIYVSSFITKCNKLILC